MTPTVQHSCDQTTNIMVTTMGTEQANRLREFARQQEFSRQQSMHLSALLSPAELKALHMHM